MKSKNYVFFLLFYLWIVLFIILLMQFIEIIYGGDIAILYPKGMIALKERNLLFVVQALMFIVVIPVFVLTFVFAWKFRATNLHADYAPDWDHNPVAEGIWWGVPSLIVIVIATFTWERTHELDPFKPLKTDKTALTVQVVALQWKWLFIYPEQEIASVNFVQFPEKTPIKFEVTADAPMNSFWIPHLGGQIYAMPKMKTILNLIADEQGSFRGCSANISGRGFAHMHFIAKSSSQEEFENWVHSVKKNVSVLDLEEYKKLAKPSEEYFEKTYLLKERELFEWIMMKYMRPMPQMMQNMNIQQAGVYPIYHK